MRPAVLLLGALGVVGGALAFRSSQPAPRPEPGPSPVPPLAPRTTYSRVLVVGDSQTAAPYGIGAELGTIFRSRGTYAAHIGRNGWGAWSYARSMGVLRNALAQHRPDLVIFQLGGNDAASNMGSPLKRTTYRRNIKDLVDAARASGAAVYWVGPSKAEAGSLFPSASAAADHQRKRTAVAASQRTILGELGVPWFDSMGLTAGLHTADGIHYPPGIAYRTWAGSLAAQMPSVTA